MDICPKCKSDSVEKAYSIGLRVAICIIFIFIPYGIFVCWLPFVFPYKYDCQVCGSEIDASDIIKMDWREREELSKEHHELEEKIAPYIGKWIQDQDERILKLAKVKGQLLLVGNNEVKPRTYRVVGFNNENEVPEIKASSEVGRKYRTVFQEAGFGEPQIPTDELSLSDLGKELLTEAEFNQMKENSNWVKEMEEDLTKIRVVINGNQG